MRNRGAAMVLAVIFLAVFAILGISLYSMGSTSIQVARNNREAQVAMAAAESGMSFLQRAISDVPISGKNASGSGTMQRIASRLQAALNGSATLGGASITVASDYSSIAIPAFAPHAGSKQRITARISLAVADLATSRPPLTLSVTGWSQTADGSLNYQRTITITMVPRDRTYQIFTYGVFAKGRVDLADGKSSIFGDPPSAGSIGSAYAGNTAIYHHGGTISGDVFVSGDPETLFSTTGRAGSIGGVDIVDQASLQEALTHIHEIDPPTIPTFTPNQYYQNNLTVITSNSQLTGNTYSDVCLQPPAGQSTVTIKIAGNQTLKGLIYVKPGVTIEFQGSPTIEGTIVVEDPNLDASGEPKPNSYLTSTSTLDFSGVPVFKPSPFPPGSVVPPSVQAELANYSILGPSAYVYLTGNSNGNDNFSSQHSGFAKTVVCGTLEEYGSGVIKIRDGTLITMSDTMVTGTEGYSSYFDGDGVMIQRSPTYSAPMAGYTHYYSWVMDRMTYRESQ